MEALHSSSLCPLADGNHRKSSIAPPTAPECLLRFYGRWHRLALLALHYCLSLDLVILDTHLGCSFHWPHSMISSCLSCFLYAIRIRHNVCFPTIKSPSPWIECRKTNHNTLFTLNNIRAVSYFGLSRKVF